MASQMLGATPPPPGIEPNFIDPPSQQRDNLVQHAVSLTLVTLFVATRVYTRLCIFKTKLIVDDYVCILSYFLDWVYSGFMIKSCSSGLGRHLWDVPAAWIPEAFKYLTLAAWAYLLLGASIKLTFLFSYRRIFNSASTVKALVHLGIAFIICLNVSLLFASVFSCRPVQRGWDSSIPGACINPVILPWLSAASSSVTDIYIFVLPMVPVWRLNMGPKRKLRVIVVFGVGLIACAASLVRLGMTPILSSSLDATWTTASIGKWSAIEVDVGLICSCFIIMPAFIRHHLPERLRTSSIRAWSRVQGMSSRRTESGIPSQRKSKRSWPSYRLPADTEFRDLNSGTKARGLYTDGYDLENLHLPEDNTESAVSSPASNVKERRQIWG